MTIINIDGIPTELENPDLDRNGKKGGIEKITKQLNEGITNITQNTELEGSLKQLNDDNINADTRMSAIDMRTRLHPVEVSAVLALDSLVALGVVPQKCLPLSTQKKRLNVSQDGKGRAEMVELVAGKRESDIKAGTFGRIGDGIKSFFGMGGGQR